MPPLPKPAEETNPEAVPELVDNSDNFEAAFAQLAKDDVQGLAPPNDPKPKLTVVEPPAEEPVVDPAPAEEAIEGAPEEPASEVQDDPDPIARLADLLDKRTTPQQPAPQPQQQQYQQPAPEAPPLFSQEEVGVIQQYAKDWPDVARAEALLRRAEAQQMLGYIFSEFAKEMRPILSQVGTLAERTHINDLHNVVVDYDDVRDKVVEWAQKQPAYLQPAYRHVIERGTVDEVKDLIDRYKQSTGVQIAAPTAPQAKKSVTELPVGVKKAAASLAPVSSKRSAVIQSEDPGDFESAFANAAKNLNLI